MLKGRPFEQYIRVVRPSAMALAFRYGRVEISIGHRSGA